MTSKMDEAAAGGSKNEVVISDCPVINVVVYKDRAEVTREISLQLESGPQEVGNPTFEAIHERLLHFLNAGACLG